MMRLDAIGEPDNRCIIYRAGDNETGERWSAIQQKPPQFEGSFYLLLSLKYFRIPS